MEKILRNWKRRGKLSPKKQSQEKNERVKERLKNQNRNLSIFKRKLIFAIGFTVTALMGLFNSIFDARVSAELTFTSISWLHGFHTGIYVEMILQTVYSNFSTYYAQKLSGRMAIRLWVLHHHMLLLKPGEVSSTLLSHQNRK